MLKVAQTDRSPKSNREWLYWGERDPLFGVCSVQGKSRTGQEPWSEEDFYARAAPEFAPILQHWDRYGRVTDACVEIGCGAGRMTSCLQRVFSRVHACDISPGMLALVKKNCDPNIVSVYETNGSSLPLPAGSVTAAFSTIVFQHFDSPAVGLAYFEEIYRVMRSGGTFMINLPWHQFPNAGIQWPYRMADRMARGYDSCRDSFKRLLIAGGPAVMNSRVGRRLGELMGATSYEFPALLRDLHKIGFRDIEVHSWYVLIEERHHPFFFGRKP